MEDIGQIIKEASEKIENANGTIVERNKTEYLFKSFYFHFSNGSFHLNFRCFHSR